MTNKVYLTLLPVASLALLVSKPQKIIKRLLLSEYFSPFCGGIAPNEKARKLIAIGVRLRLKNMYITSL